MEKRCNISSSNNEKGELHCSQKQNCTECLYSKKLVPLSKQYTNRPLTTLFLSLLFVSLIDTRAQVPEKVLIESVGGRSIPFLQVYGDTIIVERFHEGGEPIPYYLISTDRGNTFDTLTTMYETTQRDIRTGSFLCGHHYTYNLPDPGWTVFWVIRNGALHHRDSIVEEVQAVGPTIAEMSRHPTDVSLMYRLLLFTPVGADLNILEISTDQGLTWLALNVPLPSEGLGFKLQYRVDYKNANYLMVGVDGSDDIMGSRRVEWWETFDRGQSFEQIPEPGLLRSVFLENTTMEFPMIAEPIWGGELIRSNPVIKDSSHQVTDTLQWLSGIMTSLFTMGDENKYAVRVYNPPLTPDIPSGLAYALNRRGLFVCGLSVDTIQSGVKGVGIIATENNGKDWFWLMRPRSERTISQIVVDELTLDVIVSYSQSTDTNAEVRTRRVSLLTMSDVLWVDESHERSNEEVASIYPNPTDGNISISCVAETTRIVDIYITDVKGTVVYEQHNDGSVHEMTNQIDISNQPAGVYQITIIGKDGEQQREKVIIIH